MNFIYQLIPFCIRSFDLFEDLLIYNQSEIIRGTSITFDTLKIENVTSQQLYLLYAPIDVVERYQVFIESSNYSLSTQIFNNCSSPWFGEFCQYMFDLSSGSDLMSQFELIVQSSLSSIGMDPFKNRFCYQFVKCDRGPSPSCLDWREVCDGKIDCLDGGSDELDCSELYSNECTKDEYRCRNGLCISKNFFNDDRYNPDCLDRSDEEIFNFQDCIGNPTFMCEELACRNERTFSCGNGDCHVNQCFSKRDKLIWQAKLSHNANLHLSFVCWTNLICLTVMSDDRIRFFDTVNCSAENMSVRLIQENFPTLFFFPAQPQVLGHIHFAYANNLTNKYNFDNILLPDYVCYNQQLCESLVSTVRLNDSTCRLLSELNLDKLLKYDETIERRTLELFLKCSMPMNNSSSQCPKAKPFRCANSRKCLALDRLLDGFSDCFEEDDEQIKDSCSLSDKNYRFKCSSEDKCVPLNSLDRKKAICIGGEDIFNR